jgi:thiamine biosynthesis lipoprotein
MGVLNPTLEKIYSFHKEREIAVLSFRAFGTSCKVKYSPLDSIDYESVSQQVIQWVQGFEQRYSRYLENSWLSLVNASAGVKPIPLTQEDELTLRAGSFAFFQSKQTIDPSSLPLTALWQKAKAKNQLPQEHEISQAKELVNWDNVQISRDEIYLPFQGMGLDFGGFGKEFAVDKVSEKLKNFNCENFLVDFGGDIFASGFAEEDISWKVAIEKPAGKENPAFVVTLCDQAIATSGNYRKYFDLHGKRYGHTIDHRTGYPTIHSELSASIISPTCLKSGIISTTCLMGGKQAGLRLIDSEWNVEGCIQSFDSPLLSNKFYKYTQNENPA